MVSQETISAALVCRAKLDLAYATDGFVRRSKTALFDCRQAKVHGGTFCDLIMAEQQVVLALGAHPDDVEIGAGGALAEYGARGARVHLFVATEGGVGGEAAVRRREQLASAELLGVAGLHWGGFDDTRLPECAPALMARLEVLLREIRPDTVLVNFERDTHQDHRTLAEVTRSVTRWVPNVLAYETPSSIDFNPTLFMDIAARMESKFAALAAHASQRDKTRVALDIIEIARANAHFRGVQGKLACAEGFVPIRMRL
ncbi:MAG: PIG-L family deacetylase [Zetaproteobacteria bacterium]|nr:MAG: PIG-L family deacetylase [Zetaproteobacteria bacterium]